MLTNIIESLLQLDTKNQISVHRLEELRSKEPGSSLLQISNYLIIQGRRNGDFKGFFYTKSFSITVTQTNSGVIYGKMKLNSTKFIECFC